MAVADLLSDARPRLGRLAGRVLHLATASSTNTVALDESANRVGNAAPEGLVVVADEQTAGRGRRGRAWASPPGAGLYVSVVLLPASARVDPLRATLLTTLATGVALAEGIAAASGLRAELKWPNDVFASGRKLAGILAEGSGAVVVVGYGINVRDAALPPDVRERATSIERELGRVVDRGAVLVETLARLARRYDDLLDGRFDAILDAWRALSPRASGARVLIQTGAGPESGMTEGIDDHGALLVRIGGRIERIVSGEVTWL